MRRNFWWSFFIQQKIFQILLSRCELGIVCIVVWLIATESKFWFAFWMNNHPTGGAFETDFWKFDSFETNSACFNCNTTLKNVFRLVLKNLNQWPWSVEKAKIRWLCYKTIIIFLIQFISKVYSSFSPEYDDETLHLNVKNMIIIVILFLDSNHFKCIKILIVK